jgi:hypothetical protein
MRVEPIVTANNRSFCFRVQHESFVGSRRNDNDFISSIWDLGGFMNQETYPASLFPLQGDVLAGAGAVVVIVQGIQGIPVTITPPNDGDELTYVAANGDLEWRAGGGRVGVEIEGVGVSYDKLIYINGVIDGGATTIWTIEMEGTPDA